MSETADAVVPRALAGVFEWPERGARIRCRVCGMFGYPSAPGQADPRWWGWKHREHVPCPTCGRLFTPRGGLAAHRRRLHGERGRLLGGC